MLLVTTTLSFHQRAIGLTFYVAPNGDDSMTGTATEKRGAEGPFLTIERARDAIRALKLSAGLPGDGVSVEIQAGTYRLTRPLEFGHQDGGEKGQPIIYRAARNATPRITGAIRVGEFTPITNNAIRARLTSNARQNVLSAQIGKFAGTQQVGVLVPRGHSAGTTPGMAQLYYRGQPMPLARWPNDSYLLVTRLIDGKKGMFQFGGALHRPWDAETEIWAHGYWYWDWADEWLPIASIEKDQNIAEIGAANPRYGIRADQRFYFVNVLAELDAQSEWYLDRQSNTVYFWPPHVPTADDVELSVLEKLVTVEAANYLEFSGLRFEMARGNGIEVHGANGVYIRDSIVRNVQNYAVRFENSTDGGVIGSRIHDTGDGGISLIGGDRSKLTPGNLIADDNHIYRFAQQTRTARPAIWLGGVGNRAAHNHIHDGPNVGLYFDGNDHSIEFNEIDHIALETDDVGAIYIGRDWASRGNVVRNNYIHDVTGMKIGAMGVYLDDQASGVTVESNIFARVQLPVLVGGGRDNHVVGNVFVGPEIAVRMDNRGAGYQKPYWNDLNGEIRKRLESVPWNREPYVSRYPELANVFRDEPGQPVGTRLIGNFSAGDRIEEIPLAIRPFVEMNKNVGFTTEKYSKFNEAFKKIGIRSLGDSDFFGDSTEIRSIVEKTRWREIGPQCATHLKACADE